MELPKIPRLSQLIHQIGQAPQWAMSVALVSATLAVLILFTFSRRRARRQLLTAVETAQSGRAEAVRATVSAAGPLALLGACGMFVSLYGLFGFATDSMRLPIAFAIPFMAIWDLAEVTCFVSLYRSAMVEKRWTRPMRSTRRMAWGLVAASAAMNAAHAPGNWVAMVVFAAVPAVSAKLIEHELDKRLSANADSDEDEEDVTPGLVRLFQLGYVHMWAAVFAHLGLDATSRDGVIHQDARIRRAARRIHALGVALDQVETLQRPEEGTGRKDARTRGKRLQKARRSVEILRAKAEVAIDVAGIAGDTPAQLMLARHLTARGRVADLARMDTSNPMGMVALLEDLSIVPSAAAIQEGARAAQARKEREQAEQQRDAALKALAEAQAKAEETHHQAAAELANAEAVLRQAKTVSDEAQGAAEAAVETRRQAEAAVTKAEAERDRLAGEAEQLRARVGQLKTSANASENRQRELTEQMTELQAHIDQLRTDAERHQQAAGEAHAAAQQAIEARGKALGDVERAQATVDKLAAEWEQIQSASEQLAAQQREEAATIERLAAQRLEAEAQAEEARSTAARMLAKADEAERLRNAATVALQTARDELLEALTSPEDTTAPRWTSPAKVRGWELYLHTVHNEGREPTDQELAGEDRDTSTARRWLAEFRKELARTTAVALPAQQDAHDRTADQVPALA